MDEFQLENLLTKLIFTKFAEIDNKGALQRDRGFEGKKFNIPGQIRAILKSLAHVD